MKQIIVKVQVPLVSNVKHPLALVYSQDRHILKQLVCSAEILEIMKGRPKIFCYAEKEKGKDGNVLVLTGEAPWQTW
jgi:hypothetical protein